MPTPPPARLPSVAKDLHAALTSDARPLGREALAALTPPGRTTVTTALTEIGHHAERAAAALLADADPDDERLSELLTVRAWLLAVACGVARLAGTPPATAARGTSTIATAGAERLRRRYNDDLAGAYADGVMPLIDDLLDV